MTSRLAMSLRRNVVPTLERFTARRWASTSETVLENPGAIVSGLTAEDVESNPQLKAFLEYNFMKGGGSREISPADLEALGLTREEFMAESQSETKHNVKVYGEPRIDRGLGDEAQQAMNIRKIQSTVRAVDGTNACDKLRQQRLIPGIVYGSATKKRGSEEDVFIQTPWNELQRELDRYHRHIESRVYDLTVFEGPEDSDGTVYRVLPRNVQRHPVMDKIYCANFLRYHAGRPVKIPIKYINEEESPALKRDGYIIPINKYVECIIEDGVPIPEALNLECTGVQLKDVLRLDRIEFPPGVRPSDRVNVERFIVGPVYGGGRGGADDDDDEEAAAEAAPGAAKEE